MAEIETVTTRVIATALAAGPVLMSAGGAEAQGPVPRVPIPIPAPWSGGGGSSDHFVSGLLDLALLLFIGVLVLVALGRIIWALMDLTSPFFERRKRRRIDRFNGERAAVRALVRSLIESRFEKVLLERVPELDPKVPGLVFEALTRHHGIDPVRGPMRPSQVSPDRLTVETRVADSLVWLRATYDDQILIDAQWSLRGAAEGRPTGV